MVAHIQEEANIVWHLRLETAGVDSDVSPVCKVFLFKRFLGASQSGGQPCVWLHAAARFGSQTTGVVSGTIPVPIFIEELLCLQRMHRIFRVIVVSATFATADWKHRQENIKVD